MGSKAREAGANPQSDNPLAGNAHVKSAKADKKQQKSSSGDAGGDEEKKNQQQTTAVPQTICLRKQADLLYLKRRLHYRLREHFEAGVRWELKSKVLDPAYRSIQTELRKRGASLLTTRARKDLEALRNLIKSVCFAFEALAKRERRLRRLELESMSSLALECMPKPEVLVNETLLSIFPQGATGLS